MSQTTLTLTESATFAALGTVLASFNLISSTEGEAVPIVRGQANRVPEPALPDFVIMWPTGRERLSTNFDTYTDVRITGSITNNIMTVAEIENGTVQPGQIIYGAGVTAGCKVTRQVTGAPGGPGQYATTPTAPVVSNSLYLGTVISLQAVDLTIQCDVHGPYSADNAHIISTLLRDQVGVSAFLLQNPAVAPLYAETPKQVPFLNGEMQYEERWVVDVHLQANPLVIYTQQFASELQMTTQRADA